MKQQLLLTLLALTFCTGFAQEKVIWVRLDVPQPAGIPLAYSTRFDVEKDTLVVALDDTLAYLADLTLGEDPVAGPDCFVPEYKLVYRDFTYIFSLYCGKVITYQNYSPYLTSNKRIANTFEVTDELYRFLNALSVKYFQNRKGSPMLLRQVQTGDPVVDPPKGGELPPLPDEDTELPDPEFEPTSDKPLLPEVEEPSPKDDDGAAHE